MYVGPVLDAEDAVCPREIQMPLGAQAGQGDGPRAGGLWELGLLKDGGRGTSIAVGALINVRGVLRPFPGVAILCT